jgi:hypothetical protein
MPAASRWPDCQRACHPTCAVCFYDAAERESTTVAKTSSDYYEDGTCVNKVRLVRMQDLICDGGSREETELDMQLATCPRRETSRAALLGVVLSFTCCYARFQHAALQFVVQLTSKVSTRKPRPATRAPYAAIGASPADRCLLPLARQF